MELNIIYIFRIYIANFIIYRICFCNLKNVLPTNCLNILMTFKTHMEMSCQQRKTVARQTVNNEQSNLRNKMLGLGSSEKLSFKADTAKPKGVFIYAKFTSFFFENVNLQLTIRKYGWI